jgi:hypothetical protein
MRCTAQSGQYFLNIPGMQTQQNIKDADDVDKLANAAVSQGKLRPQRRQQHVHFSTRSLTVKGVPHHAPWSDLWLSMETRIMHCI